LETVANQAFPRSF